MKELILRNERLKLSTVLKMNNYNEVISSTIFFDAPMEVSVIFPARGILFGIPQQSQVPDVPNPMSRFPMRKGVTSQTNLPDWLAKDLKRRQDGRD